MYILVLYTNFDNLTKVKQLKSTYFNKLHNCKVIIVYGNLQEKLQENNYEFDSTNDILILNCIDTYEGLTDKSFKLFQTINKLFPNATGCFKCNDDIIPNIDSINIFMIKNKHDYVGNCTKTKSYYSKWHYNKCSSIEFNTPKLVPECSYCGSPLYYLSKKALNLFNTDIDTSTCVFYEDVAIGVYLTSKGIEATNFPLYSNDIIDIDTTSFQNTNKKQILYIQLVGGLGNQLFQNCFIYSLAKDCNCSFVIMLSLNKPDRENENYTNTIFSKFPKIVNGLTNFNITKYIENGCDFSTFNNNYSNIINNKKDMLFHGYFQNEKFFKKYKNELIKTLTDNILYQNIEPVQAYFIHIRRGDYVNNTTHYIDLTNYYINAIRYILEKDKNITFYIISDDLDWCKTEFLHNVLEIFLNSTNTNIIFYENSNELETLYFMSKCIKGGICGNSTFAWWGSYLNINSDKIVIFPNKWINNNWPVDIYYENSIVLNV
jgi:hypothetical protein